jgi:hypothetical protein
MSFTLTLRDRMDYLSHIGPGIADVFDAYERPFAEQRVIGPKGKVVPAIPARLARAQARVMRSVASFEAVAAEELEHLERRKSA